MQTSPYRLTWLLATVVSVASFTAQAQDPTRPYGWTAGRGVSSQQDTNLVLAQVVVSATSQRALINNQWLSLGDTIAGFRVADIGSNSVTLSNGSVQRILKLFQPLNIKNIESQGDQQ
ncbi:MAG: Type II secretory pathway component [Idiomarina sp. T82-3]|uniref:MSHA biogenesis protein MshK n=1 Tax=Idiomarina TaxID=135575 RepID=UPI000795D314|nr:MSHA biogenesis protein MshK [Idiomarina sp. T82-3]KXS36600.1 MAG: Type II secretory pathway component [Idiomarina sp. T82-3]